MAKNTIDYIGLDQAETLPDLFRERLKRDPQGQAYRYFDSASNRWESLTWGECGTRMAAIRAMLGKERLAPGDRVAIMLRNCPAWVLFEQAAMSLGLVVVPLYPNDRPENVAYILQDAQVKAMLVAGESALRQLSPIEPQLQGLNRLLSVEPCQLPETYPRLMCMSDWEQQGKGLEAAPAPHIDPHSLATIVYTSGTTGRPKGVMLNHHNILYNVQCALQAFEVYREDVFLSFLPLSHMLERTVGYLLPMVTGSTVVYARSVQDLATDLLSQRPTVLISVPRIYERVYHKLQMQLEKKSPFAQKLFHRAVEVGWARFRGESGGSWQWLIVKQLVAKKILNRLGGRLRLAVCGGAPISYHVAKLFIGLGLPIIHGYGLTETSPMVSGNTLSDNDPASVGKPLPGIDVKVGDNDELLTRSPSVMMGYWQNEAATRDMIDADGWLHTGDQVHIEEGRIYITGRLKEIIVLSNGEKVPPADMEIAITLDSLFEQALIIGEGKFFLAAMVVLEKDTWRAVAEEKGFDLAVTDILETKPVRRYILSRIRDALQEFPGYAKVRAVIIRDQPWSIEEGTMTPTLKLRRSVIVKQAHDQIEAVYHDVSA